MLKKIMDGMGINMQDKLNKNVIFLNVTFYSLEHIRFIYSSLIILLSTSS